MAKQPELSSRHKRTLSRIFEHPVPPDLPWREIENLLIALGAEIEERRGSRISVTLAGEVNIFHRPHPRPAANRGAVVAVRKLLEFAGVSP